MCTGAPNHRHILRIMLPMVEVDLFHCEGMHLVLRALPELFLDLLRGHQSLDCQSVSGRVMYRRDRREDSGGRIRHGVTEFLGTNSHDMLLARRYWGRELNSFTIYVLVF